MNRTLLGALLLLAGGIINTAPPLGTTLSGIFDGTPVVQMVVGVLSMIVGIWMLVKEKALA